MPRLKEQTSKLKKITTRFDIILADQISSAMAKLGMRSRAEFIRLSVTEKVNNVLREESSNKGEAR